jgi:hypothetical protein
VSFFAYLDPDPDPLIQLNRPTCSLYKVPYLCGENKNIYHNRFTHSNKTAPLKNPWSFASLFDALKSGTI